MSEGDVADKLMALSTLKVCGSKTKPILMMHQSRYPDDVPGHELSLTRCAPASRVPSSRLLIMGRPLKAPSVKWVVPYVVTLQIQPRCRFSFSATAERKNKNGIAVFHNSTSDASTYHFITSMAPYNCTPATRTPQGHALERETPTNNGLEKCARIMRAKTPAQQALSSQQQAVGLFETAWE